jgi:hypothetical protein
MTGFIALFDTVHGYSLQFTIDNDSDNDKPIKSLLKGKGLLPPVGLARLDS